MLTPKPVLFALALLGVIPTVLRANETSGTLTNAAGVLSLTAQQASQKRPVRLTGIVTAAEPDWRGQFFVQDATGGVFVENISAEAPRPGDVVAMTGVSHPGAFAPIVSEPHWRITGRAPLPEPKAVTIESLESGAEDGLRIEVAGVVRTVEPDVSGLGVDLAVGGYRLRVRTPLPPGMTPASLVGAQVRLRGTTATHYNAALRHLTAVAVYVPRAEDFTIVRPEAEDPFLKPARPLNSLAEYHRGDSGARIHVRGVVTLQRIGEDVYLQDSTGGIRIVSTQYVPLEEGDAVEAAGFLEYENFLPVLRDATLRKSAAARMRPKPRVVPVADLKAGRHHADLIALRGKILDRSSRPVARSRRGFVGIVTTWLIQGDGLGFTIEREDRVEDAALTAIPVGSLVEATGVALSEVDEAGKLKSLKLLLASPTGLRVLERPSWFTPERLLVGVGLLSIVLVVVGLWSVTVSRKNRALQKAQGELQEAHDTLEQKVIERSAQLQVEMTARKTAEVQFKAVLAERTRLARDLHDTLEQTLTGIALQLDAAAKLFTQKPQSSSHHLELGRNWLRQSQVDLRRSIWDLRSRELEQFDLAHALQQSAEHLVHGTEIQLEFTTQGPKRGLPEVLEENVLRIGQEALTNIAKHARASRIIIALEYGAAVLTLRIADNGVGFAPGPSPSPGDNHFGLLGMSERAKRIAARLAIASEPGRGTQVTLEIPLETAPVNAPESPVGSR